MPSSRSSDTSGEREGRGKGTLTEFTSISRHALVSLVPQRQGYTHVEVRFLDYGNQAVVHVTLLKELKEEFARLPFQVCDSGPPVFTVV